MRLLEYEAKNLLSACEVPIPRGKVFAINELQAIAASIVLKSQVPIGGRGKLGGVQIVRRQSAIESVARKMFNLKIKGFLPSKLLAEEVLGISHEFYFSLNINRQTAAINCLPTLMVASKLRVKILQPFFGAILPTKNSNL